MTEYYTPNTITNIMLNVTDACNLACRYCFVEQHPHYMTYEVAKDTVDFFNEIILKKNPDCKNIRDLEKKSYDDSGKGVRHGYGINFFGGEPLLMWDEIIVPLTKYIKKNKFPIGLGMTSNCTLLDEKKMKFMKENEIGLLFSIDGAKETQDYNRPCHNPDISSFDILEPKLEMIAKIFPTTFRSTLIPETCHNMFDNAMFAHSKGFHQYFACPDDFGLWTEDSISELEKGLYKWSLYYIDCYKSQEALDDMIHFSPLEKMMGSLKKIQRRSKENEEHRFGKQMCGLGTGGFAVNYEGAIFGCQELPSRGYDDNLHYIGNIYTGYDKPRFEALLNDYRGHELTCEDPSLCERCYNRFICSEGFCHANSYLKFGNEYTKPRIRCIWDDMLVKYAVFVSKTLKDYKLFPDRYVLEEEIDG